MLGLINRTQRLTEQMTDKHIILQIGNIDILFTEGAKFEASGNLSDLEGVRQRFILDTLYQAHVFLAWVHAEINKRVHRPGFHLKLLEFGDGEDL